ncbi:MAG: right-handed parallel beta-helix repeat-containing protein [Chloroflexota bacterium]
MDWATQQTILYHAPFGAIVDINGTFNPKTGRFWQPQDAIDAGHKSIFIRKGTYAPFTTAVDDLFILGESTEALIDGTTVSTAVTISGARVTLQNLAVTTLSGGGNSFNGVTASGVDVALLNLYVPNSDNVGLFFTAARGKVRGCLIADADATGIGTGSGSDNAQINNNHVRACGGDEIQLTAGADNSVVTGNIVEGGVVDNSVGSTVANNEAY